MRYVLLSLASFDLQSINTMYFTFFSFLFSEQKDEWNFSLRPIAAKDRINFRVLIPTYVVFSKALVALI